MKRILTFLLITILLMATFPLSFVASAADAPDGEYILDEIIIGFHDRSLFPGQEKQYDDEVAKVLKDGLSLVRENVYLVKSEDFKKNPNATLNRYKNSKFIEYVEPNYTAKLDVAPNDPAYKNIGIAFAKIINAEAGWDIITKSNVKVALIDSGYSGNTDLPNASGYNILNGGNDLTDKNGHGTQVAGTIGELGNTGKGNAGVIWNANLLPIKITESSSVTLANVVSGIDKAVASQVRVINLSLSFTSDSISLKKAVDSAYNAGCIIVASTGNDSKGTVNYPAAYSNVLSVGGTSNGTTRSTLSNYGNGLDVMASWAWYTTNNSGGFITMSGTSIASPQVAGLAALIWELAPNLSKELVIDIIKKNTNRGDGKVLPTWDSQTGYGTIDMGKTLEAALILGGGKPKDTEPPVITLVGEVELTLPYDTAYTEPGYTATDETDGDLTKSVTITNNIDPKTPGTYEIIYEVADAAGNTAKATRTITVGQPPDTIPPVLELNGPTEITLEYQGEYREEGYTAMDDVDGDLWSKVTITGSLDTWVPGVYEVIYEVSDSAGNKATAIRTITVNEPPQEELPTEEPPQAELPTEEPPQAELPTEEPEPTEEPPQEEQPTEEPPQEELPPDEPQEPETQPEPEQKAEPEPTVPIITIIGSNPIVLHLEGTPYTEQGAKAYDDTDGDLTSNVRVSGSVNTSKAGTYTITYSITNSFGIEASTTRDVQILAPTEKKSPRTEYNFSGQGKQGAVTTHKDITANVEGQVDFSLTNLGNKTTVTVTMKNSGGTAVFKETFVATASKTFYVDAGNYTVDVSIDAANGNSQYGFKLKMPEEISLAYTQPEVAYGTFDPTKPAQASDIATLAAVLGVALTVMIFSQY